MNPRRITINGVEFDIATPEQPASPVLEKLDQEADHVPAAEAAHRDALPDMTPEPDRATACGGVLLPLGAVLFGLAIVVSILVVGS